MARGRLQEHSDSNNIIAGDIDDVHTRHVNIYLEYVVSNSRLYLLFTSQLTLCKQQHGIRQPTPLCSNDTLYVETNSIYS